VEGSRLAGGGLGDVGSGRGRCGWQLGRAQAGYAKTGGNTDTSTANGLFHITHVVDDWKLLFGAEGFYGSTKGETTAQAWDAHLQANYNINQRLYWYSGVRYHDNKFSGFAYQETVSSGLGYQFVKTDDTRLSAQLGVGARRLRPELEDSLGAIAATSQLPPTTDAVPRSTSSIPSIPPPRSSPALRSSRARTTP
jgi:putative salt-induced outer membrane protein YdiY